MCTLCAFQQSANLRTRCRLSPRQLCQRKTQNLFLKSSWKCRLRSVTVHRAVPVAASDDVMASGQLWPSVSWGQRGVSPTVSPQTTKSVSDCNYLFPFTFCQCTCSRGFRNQLNTLLLTTIHQYYIFLVFSNQLCGRWSILDDVMSPWNSLSAEKLYNI